MPKKIVPLVFLLSSFLSHIVVAEQLSIGEFSTGNLDGWKQKEFSSKTRYEITQLDSETALLADSRDSASALYKKQRIDISKYPYINWRWRIENKLDTGDEKLKSGDDYAARVYVVVSGGIAIWRTKAINYVWANSSPKYDIWPNAFAGNKAIMLAQRSSGDKTSTWVTEKRNVYEDFKKLFGAEIRYVDGVALMTDTDNNGGSAKSYYGDIYFTSE